MCVNAFEPVTVPDDARVLLGVALKNQLAWTT